MPICPQCGGQHSGLQPGDILPPDAKVRRAIIPGKEGPPLSKSNFKSDAMSADLVARPRADTLATIGATKYVEFEVREAMSIFKRYRNSVVFRCIPGNPYHCQVEGNKTDGEARLFAALMSRRIQP